MYVRWSVCSWGWVCVCVCFLGRVMFAGDSRAFLFLNKLCIHAYSQMDIHLVRVYKRILTIRYETIYHKCYTYDNKKKLFIFSINTRYRTDNQMVLCKAIYCIDLLYIYKYYILFCIGRHWYIWFNSQSTLEHIYTFLSAIINANDRCVCYQ